MGKCPAWGGDSPAPIKGRLLHKLGPAGQQGAQGIATVTAGVFFVPGQFGGGFVYLFVKKNGVYVTVAIVCAKPRPNVMINM